MKVTGGQEVIKTSGERACQRRKAIDIYIQCKITTTASYGMIRTLKNDENAVFPSKLSISIQVNITTTISCALIQTFENHQQQFFYVHVDMN